MLKWHTLVKKPLYVASSVSSSIYITLKFCRRIVCKMVLSWSLGYRVKYIAQAYRNTGSVPLWIIKMSFIDVYI